MLTGHAEWNCESDTCEMFSHMFFVFLVALIPINVQYRNQKNLVFGLNGKPDLGPSG